MWFGCLDVWRSCRIEGRGVVWMVVEWWGFISQLSNDNSLSLDGICTRVDGRS